MPNYPYTTIGLPLDLKNWEQLNTNFDNIEIDFKDQKSRIDNIANEIQGELAAQIIDSAKITWQEPVDAFVNLETDYPTPEIGWAAMARDTGKVYRFDGTDWLEIQDIDPTAINEVDSRLTSQLAETETDLQTRGISPLEFGVVGDGVTDDTANLQAYINDCQSNNKLMALNGTFAVTGITFGAGARVVGVATFNAINDNQTFVVQATSKINWVGKMTVDGKNKALKGFSGADFIASHFGEVETRNCKKWGFVFERTGNNNLVQVDYFRGTNNGKKHNSNYTVATSTVEGAYQVKRLTLATPLNVNDFTGLHDVIFVLYNGRPYKVKQVIDVSTIDVYNMPVAVSDTGVFDVIVGGSLNIQSYGDNGVGNWGVVDIYGTPGIAVNMSSLYGHTFGRIVLQGCSIGIGVSDITNGVVMHSPYFELNNVDIVAWSYLDGTIYNPIIELNKIYNLIQHNLFGIDYNPRLNIIMDKKTPNMSEAPSTINSASRTLYPSNMYAFNYTTSPSARTFTIKNDVVYKNTHSAFLNLFLEVPGSLEVTFALSNANGETIEGGSTFTTTCNGDTHFLIFVNSNNDWRVVKLQRDYDSVAIPSAGTYRTGDYVKKRVPVQAGTAGSRYVVKGWIRLTDGNAHVLGTDWVEDRALTGN